MSKRNLKQMIVPFIIWELAFTLTACTVSFENPIINTGSTEVSSQNAGSAETSSPAASMDEDYTTQTSDAAREEQEAALTQESENQTVIYDGVEYETDPEQAGFATQLKDAMINRQETLRLYYATEGDVDLVLDEMGVLLQRAFDETDNPKAGDSLNNQVSYQVSASGYSVGNTSYLEIAYDFSYYTTAEQEAALDAAVAEIVSGLNLPENASDYEKAWAVYQYLVEEVAYDYDTYYGIAVDNTGYSAYGALVEGNAVCEGYAVAMYRLLTELGVPVRCITGATSESASATDHEWNLVQIEGTWYQCDATWDANMREEAAIAEALDNGSYTYQYFLRGTEDLDATEVLEITYPDRIVTYYPGNGIHKIIWDELGDYAISATRYCR